MVHIYSCKEAATNAASRYLQTHSIVVGVITQSFITQDLTDEWGHIEQTVGVVLAGPYFKDEDEFVNNAESFYYELHYKDHKKR